MHPMGQTNFSVCVPFPISPRLLLHFPWLICQLPVTTSAPADELVVH